MKLCIINYNIGLTISTEKTQGNAKDSFFSKSFAQILSYFLVILILSSEKIRNKQH